MSYGCHNRAPFRAVYAVQAGWYMDGTTRTPRLEAAKHVLSKDCQYTLSELGRVDAKCLSCKWRAAHA